MSGAQHTPGPWVVRNGCNVFADAEHIPLTNNAYIAVTGGLSGSDTIERDSANARLIAAAPEMLEALYQYVSDLRFPPEGDSVQRRIERAEAVIAKATGQ